MQRNNRRAKAQEEGFSIKNALYVGGAILALGVIAFVITVMIYNNSLEKIYDDLGSRESVNLANTEKDSEKTEETSANLGKTVEEAKEASTENEEAKEVVAETKKEDIIKTKIQETKPAKIQVTPEQTKAPTPTKEEKKELAFETPVQGEIIKEYAKDKLVYSETLKEWVTHMGIDIKAEKTTIVKAAEDGKITAIKNDPRYGTTVIIEHQDGFETRYANLLTAEFVNVGEKVTKGQTIGTVGNTAAFEIMDEPHLHFEILKNGEYQDPSMYLK